MNAKMDCPSPQIRSQYLRGELSDALAEQMEGHLETCAACLQTLAGEADLDAFCRSVSGAGKCLSELSLFADQVARLKADLRSLWPAGIGAQDAVLPVHVVDLLEPPQAADELGRLDDYRILKVQGRGGMGVVFLAEEKLPRRQVAIKMMLPKYAADPAVKERFLREAHCSAQIEHDNVIPIFRVVDNGKAPYIVMRLLRGQSLAERLRSGPPIPTEEALRIGRQVALGLDEIHAGGLIHRDITPANLWLEDGPQAGVKILDFGLARPSDAAADVAHPTEPGAVMGTPQFMAPEQALGRAVDYRADIYSLGVVLYRLVAGRLPFTASTPQDHMAAHANAIPDELAPLNDHVPRVVARTIMNMLEKEPHKRPTSARAVADAMLLHDEPPTQPMPPSVAGKQRWPVLAAAAVLAAIAGFGAWQLFPNGPTPEYKGSLAFALTQRGGKDIVGKTDTYLGDPGFLAMHQGDHGFLDAKLNHGPPAHFYVIRIDTAGQATPRFPEGWTWAELPASNPKRSSLRWPEIGAELIESRDQGLMSLLWLVRTAPLSTADLGQLKSVLIDELHWKQPDHLEDEIYLLENGKLTLERADVISEHPVRQTEAALLKIHKQKLADYSRAVCFPFRIP